MERVCLGLVALIGGVILSAWLIPFVGSILFRQWMMMKANTALMLLLVTLSLALSQSRRSARMLVLSRLIGVVVLLTAGAVLVEYAFHISLGLDTLLAADRGSPQPGRMSPQTAVVLGMLSIAAIFIREQRRVAAYVLDVFVFTLCPLVVVIVSGYAFGVMHLFGISAATRTSPHTLLALILLTFVVFARRTELGFFSIFTGAGIGSKIARAVAPLALAIPFALETARFGIVQTRLIGPEYSTALVTALAGVMGFALVLLLAWRIDSLEQEIRDLSLRDDLTRLYNRRGFMMLADRELRLARRSEVPFSVLFIDLDNLKQINDTFGHEVGSEFLREMAELLRRCFRESDILGRIGGDEFVVAGAASEEGIAQASRRLEMAAAERNADPGRRYPIGFSLGHATTQVGGPELEPTSLDDLLNRADSAMYAIKRNKKLARRG